MTTRFAARETAHYCCLRMQVRRSGIKCISIESNHGRKTGWSSMGFAADLQRFHVTSCRPEVNRVLLDRRHPFVLPCARRRTCILAQGRAPSFSTTRLPRSFSQRCSFHTANGILIGTNGSCSAALRCTDASIPGPSDIWTGGREDREATPHKRARCIQFEGRFLVSQIHQIIRLRGYSCSKL